MILNFLKQYVRSMRRHPVYALINVFGLGLGLSASFMVLLWVQDEMSFDHFHKDAERIYQVMRTAENGGTVSTTSSVTAELQDVLDEDYPEITYSAMFSREQPVSFVRGDRAFRKVTRYAGPDVFEILSFRFLAGDPVDALRSPESIVLTESMARLYFPEHFEGLSPEGAARSLLGETIRYENRMDLEVTGVAADAPPNSSLKFEAFLPFDLYARENSWVANWGSNAFKMFVKLADGANGPAVSQKIRSVIQDHSPSPENDVISLQPLQDRYLWSRYENGVVVGGRIGYVRIMGVVGLLILIIAAINFTNLATARSQQRAREIGVRKTFGGSRGGLASQFLTESVLTSVLGLVLAIGSVAILLPAFNEVTGKAMSLAASSPAIWLGFLVLTLLTGLASGAYPALYLSGLGVSSVIKQRDSGPGGGRPLRQGLVVFQFATSILLIVGTLTVYEQIEFIQSVNLGLDRDNVITARLEGGARESWEPFRTALLGNPAVVSATSTDGHPFEINQSTSSVEYDGRDPEDTSSFFLSSVGHDYLETMHMELVAGRAFDAGRALDSANVIINETAAARMGFADPVGQRFSVWGREGEIIGVVKDFQMQSMYRPIEPVVLRLDGTYAQSFLVRAAPGKAVAALAAVESTFRTFSPGYPFEPSFLETEYDTMYRSEEVIGRLASWFAILAVTIACLGLYGLASFTTSRRTKEIGVRKVLGASVSNIAALLTREFVVLVAVSFALASPIAWWLMSDWLNSFEYHAEFGPGLFLVAAAGMLALTYATVGVHSIRAARADPARSLRSE
jgi:putative ABC transport system permease protein